MPIEACRFDASVELEPGTGKTTPVTIFARSAQPIVHWFFGRFVNDMAGMLTDKESIPIDYCHCADEVMGYGDQIDASNEGLKIVGQLVPFTKDDRASEVIYKSGNKVPYQGSINFDPMRLVLETVGEGFSSQVNGYAFEGPGVIARQWVLRGVAICPYGADSSSEIELSAARRSGVTVPVTYLTQEPSMATETKPAEPVAGEIKPAETKPAAEAKPATETKPAEGEPAKPAAELKPAAEITAAAAADATSLSAPGKRFLDAFGEQGGVWFAQGKTFDESQVLFHASTGEKLKSKDAEIATLKTQLTALRGEDPVGFEAEQSAQQKKATELAASGLNDNISKIAAGIKLPK